MSSTREKKRAAKLMESKAVARASKPTRRVKSKNLKLQSQIHMKSLDAFYEEKQNFDTLYNFVTSKGKLSRRVLEFLCTKMAAKTPILLAGANGEKVDLHSRYQTYLDSSGKKWFDCFSRNEKAKFQIEKHGKKIKTTVAQLRFFRFLIREGILEYATAHLDEIMSQMSDKLRKDRAERAKRKRDDEQKEREMERLEAGEEPDSAKPPRKRRRRTQTVTKCHGSTASTTLTFKH